MFKSESSSVVLGLLGGSEEIKSGEGDIVESNRSLKARVVIEAMFRRGVFRQVP